MGRMSPPTTIAIALAAAVAWPAPAAAAPAAPAEIRDGPARFQVLSPSLIRLEYAEDGVFEDRPTLTVPIRRAQPAEVDTKVRKGVRLIRTSRMLLRYRVGTGPFTAENLRLQITTPTAKRRVRPSFPVSQRRSARGAPARAAPPPNPDPDPSPVTAGNLGGWYRGLDGQAEPVQLHDGLLSTEGWYLLDDTSSPLLVDRGRWYEPRPAHEGAYQDGYLFAYADDYAGALSDLRNLTGPAPLLPRSAFGNWFSRYQGYSEDDYRRLIGRFRTARVPLDVLVIDTDFKWPANWNGWHWTPNYFENPSRFMNWTQEQGLDVMLNVHPSIPTDDPSFEAANAIAGGLIDGGESCRVCMRDPEGTCAVWDWANRAHVASYFSLHEPFEAIGVENWWLDCNCDESRANAPGLTADSWINYLYARRQRDRGLRWLPLGRIGSSLFDYGGASTGAWAEHRSAIHFTGDALSTWEMLDFQTRFTAAEGAGIGLPYVSHDIGGFTGDELEGDLYVRWIQSGFVQPILRLHSDHAPRLPWEYDGRAKDLAALFLRLRGSYVPYLYTLAREAYDTGLPLARAMYLRWPRSGDAYRFDRQYMLGDQLLVAPVANPGDPARKRVWFPPGDWVDVFTGEVHSGPRAETLRVPLERMPLFARAGSVVPRQEYAERQGGGVPDPLILNVYAGDDGEFELYEDEGVGFGYRNGQFARTVLRWREESGGAALTIGRAVGRYPGDPERRAYSVRVLGVDPPAEVTIDGRRVSGADFSYDQRSGLLAVETPRLSTRRGAVLRIELGDERAR